MQMSNYHFQEFLPKIISCIKEGYNRKFFLHDLLAGISTGVIALPLALAFAIGSGVSPEKGLFTAIIAGFLISLLGGSRVQISGPTGAFVVIVYMIIQRHGYEGLAVATLIAGVLLIAMGLARFGVLLKFIPYPVTTGFTTGIALVIFSGQIKDFFGLQIDQVPPQFLEKCLLFCLNAYTWNPWAFAISTGTLVLIFVLRRYYPRLPGVIIAIILATGLSYFFSLPLETIEGKFGEIPRVLPTPALPAISYDLIKRVFPDAITIAFLCAIESLLSAVVADGMTGQRHRSNCELVAQGLGNLGSILFGGIPATGAIARTTANIKMGAKTPIAGMLHAVTLLLLMLLFAPLAGKIPLCTLSAVLIFVAWNMSELGHFYEILKSQWSEATILVVTFLLTVLVDLTVAVQIGVVMAAFIFVKKMSDNTNVKICRTLLDENQKPLIDDSNLIFRKDIPDDVTVFEMTGPLFYSNADSLNETLSQLSQQPRVFILRMEKVPIVDSTGIKAIKDFQRKCRDKGIQFLICGASPQLHLIFKKSGVEKVMRNDHFFSTIDSALSFDK